MTVVNVPKIQNKDFHIFFIIVLLLKLFVISIQTMTQKVTFSETRKFMTPKA